MKYLFLFIFSFWFTFNSFATNYYISTTGNDANNGTSSGTPKLTLADIFADYNLGSGDIIYVAAGTYTETGITVGSDDEGFTIEGAALSSGIPTSIFDATSTSRWLLLNNSNNDNITIDNLTIKDYKNSDGGSPGGGGAIKVIAGATGLTVNYCVFNNCDTRTASLQHRGGAIYSAEGISVNYSSFYNCDAEYYGGAISVELSPSANSTISYCKFYSNNATNYGTAVFFGISTTHSLTMTNCLFYENGNTSGEAAVVGMNTGSTINVINCTITKNGNASNGTGGVLALSSAKVYMTNTIIYNNTGTTYNDVYNNTSTITMTKCCYGSSSEINSITTNTSPLVANPLFSDATNDDYSLSSTSPCIDVGTSTGAPSDDIDTGVRDSNIDIGAYEYGAIPLPIQLISFSTDYQHHLNRVLIKWLTGSETNNDYFTLEKSNDGIHFYEFSRVKGQGTTSNITNYVEYDHNPYIGITYYRIKQTDYNGDYSYSPIETISSFQNEKETFNVYPNPATENEINLNYFSKNDGEVLIKLYSLDGSIVMEESRKIHPNQNIIKLELNSNLAKSIYFLELKNKDEVLQSKVQLK